LVTETINQSFPLTAGSRTMSAVRDVVLTKRCGNASKKWPFWNSFNLIQNKTWKRCGNAVPTRSRPTTPLNHVL